MPETLAGARPEKALLERTAAHFYEGILAAARDGSDFVTFEKELMSYPEFLDQLQRTVGLLRSLGLARQDRILIQTAHDRHAITLFVAAFLEGLVPVLLTADTPDDRASSIARHVDAAHAFVDRHLFLERAWLRERAVTLVGEAPPRSSLLDRLRKSVPANAPRVYPVCLGAMEALHPASDSAPDDLLYILFTSGTTADPKGVMITHGNMFSHLATFTRLFGYDRHSVIFNNMALGHADGLFQGPILALYNGCRLYRPEAFDMRNLETMFARLRGQGVTHVVTVPTILALLDAYSTATEYFSSPEFRHVFSVSAKLDVGLWQRLEQRFGVSIVNIYGLTETVSGGLYCLPHHARRSGAVGAPVDMEARISGGGESGELLLRGSAVTPGYFRNREASDALFADGWLQTGDLARSWPDGTYAIVGRLRALIMCGGFNIHPEEINEVLMRHPSVVEAVSVGIEDLTWGEIPVSMVILSAKVAEADLAAHCRQYLEEKKCPKRILVADAFPRGDAGKPQLASVAAMARERLKQQNAGGGEGDEGKLLALAAGVFKVAPDSLSLQTTPETTNGWDSFSHITLVTTAEEVFGVRIEARRIIAMACLQDLLDAVVSARGAARP
jgi:long-chain acyl-CoA synthetase